MSNISLRNIPIYVSDSESLNIFQEQLLSIHQNISLQYFPQKGQPKQKISELTLHIKTFRCILFSQKNQEQRFEIHFDLMKSNFVPIKSGFFSSKIYKSSLCYKSNQNFLLELKNNDRSDFSEIHQQLYSAYEKSFQHVK